MHRSGLAAQCHPARPHGAQPRHSPGPGWTLSPACSLGLGQLGALVALALLAALGGARGVGGRGGGWRLLGFDGALGAPRLGFLREREGGGLGTQRCTGRRVRG
eukprot:scaffold11677_cov46-Phaeocystis_antarctica.AAC.3